MNHRQWKPPVADKESRGKLATGWDAHGLEQKVMEIHMAEKIYPKNLLNDAGEAMSLGEECPHETTIEEESGNMELPGVMARRVNKTGRADDWSELMKIDELHSRMMAKLKESCYQTSQGAISARA